MVVTGASMGIGDAIAKAFCEDGANVVLCSRELQRAEEARQKVGSPERTMAVACDVRERAQIDALVKKTLERFGKLDIFVNNAGHGMLDGVATMDVAKCRAMFDTNLFGAIECMQAVIPVMKLQLSGCIINISSVAGHIPVPFMSAYSATKHALNAISKSARVELKPFGIHVLTVCPGFIRTDFSIHAVKGNDVRRFSGALRRGITAERCAKAVLNAYLGGKREIMVPASDWLKVKAYQLLPKLIESVMERSIQPITPESISAEETARKKA